MKKTVSLILSFALLLTVFSAAFTVNASAAQSSPEYDGYPVVLVRGMDFNGLYYKLGTDEEERAFAGVDAGEVIGVLLRALGAGVLNLSVDAGLDEVIAYVNSILGRMACDKNGLPAHDVSVREYPLSLANYPELWDMGDFNEYGILKTAVEKFGAENVYYYNYDWRLDPLTHADRINALVEQAKKDTGKDKVNIMCASMGGIMTESYIYKYGHASLNRVMFMSSTFCGTYVVSDLLNGRVNVDGYGLYRYADKMLAADNVLLSGLFTLLNKAGFFGRLADFANGLIPKLQDKVFDDFLRDTFGTMPALWALMLPEDYDGAVEYMFGGMEEEYSAIIELSKEYQKMTAARDDFLRAAEEDGVNILVIASYDTPCIPVYERAVENGDGTLESALMLGMANVAPLGKTLGEGYTAENPARLSPDGVVDLSNALFPETTWAVCGSPHVATSYGTDYSDFIFTLLTYNGRATVDTFEAYPQFMRSSSAQELKYF